MQGVVKCYGDSMFLKEHYGVGYHLTMVKESGCQVTSVTALVQQHVSTAVLEGDVRSFIFYFGLFFSLSRTRHFLCEEYLSNVVCLCFYYFFCCVGGG